MADSVDADRADEQSHNESPTSPVPQKEKKRSRVQFSCTACRHRKLKCDRTHPCSNCTRRGDAASCAYIGRGPRGKGSHTYTNPGHVQNRLQHLENLVLSFAQKRRLEGQETTQLQQALGRSGSLSNNSDSPQGGSAETGLLKLASEEKKDLIDSPGRIFVEDVGTSYIDASHWRAILEEINEVKEYLQENDEGSEETDIEPQINEPPGPTLLTGLSKPMSMEELLADIPSRRIVDRFVARSFNSRYPSLVVIHFPTFQKEYTRFWQNPHAVSVPWLGLLYALMVLAVAVHHRSDEPLPECLGNSLDFLSLYRKRAAQCLSLSNYTKPGRYKVEALMMYCFSEFLRTDDAHASVSFLLGLIIKLAMRMGYHRDSKHYPNISAYEGEMRRRVWAVICQLDTLTSFQVGLPKSVQDWQFDTELPHNLMDEDFHENIATLPPSRPETEFTPLSYTVCKSRIMSVFGSISDLAYSREPASYDKVLELDKRLEGAYGSIPPVLRIRSIDESITDSPELIMRRYTLVLLYQKARCVLHRKYLTETRSNLRYTYSRWVCIDAAKEVLRHQADIYHEVEAGGQLYQERWFISSLQNHDFLLAAMIICLELSHNRSAEAQTCESGQGFTITFEGKEDLLRVLESSHGSFKLSSLSSNDSRKAYDAMTVMLKRAKRSQSGVQNTNRGVPMTSSSNSSSTMAASSTSSVLGGKTLRPEDSYLFNQIDTLPQTEVSDAMQDNTASLDIELRPLSSFGIIEDMLDAPNTLDWDLWDGQMQGMEPEDINHFWGNDSTTTDFH